MSTAVNAQLGLVSLFGPAHFPPRCPAQDLDPCAHMEQINQLTNHTRSRSSKFTVVLHLQAELSRRIC